MAKYSNCCKNNNFIQRLVVNFYSLDNFLYFCKGMKLHLCLENRDEIIPAETCEYNIYFDQRQE